MEEKKKTATKRSLSSLTNSGRSFKTKRGIKQLLGNKQVQNMEGALLASLARAERLEEKGRRTPPSAAPRLGECFETFGWNVDLVEVS